MLRTIFRWICIVICAFFAITGTIAYFFMDQKEGLLMMMLGIFMPIYYYGYVKEGSIGNLWMAKFAQSKNGKIILAILFVIFILGRLFKSALN